MDKNIYSSIPDNMKKIIEKNIPPSVKCYAFLKEGILTGYFAHRQRIVERDIISLLSVSRTPLREALRKLEKENLVEYSRNKGCTVAGLSGQDICELFELRKLLECFMIKVIARTASREELSSLREELIEKKGSVDEDGNYWNFHIQMLKLSRHRKLNIMLGQLEEYIERFHVISFTHTGRSEQAYNEHLGIIDALLDGDPDSATAILERHLDESFEVLRVILAFV